MQEKEIISNTAIISQAEISYQKRKKVVICAFVCILALCIAWFAIPTAHAFASGSIMDIDQAEIKAGNESYTKKTYTLYMNAVAGEMTDGMMGTIDALVGGNANGGLVYINSAFAQVKTTIETSAIYTTIGASLKGIAMFLVILYSFIHLFSELQRGDGEIDMWLRCFVVVAVGLLVVINWQVIMDTLEKLGIYLEGQISKSVSNTDYGETIKTWIESNFGLGDDDIKEVTFGWISTWGTAIANMISNLGFYLIIIGKGFLLTCIFIGLEIPLMGARITLLSIIIELTIRKALFPLALADISGNGLRSPGVASMKKIVAVYIRLGMCYIIAALTSLIVGAFLVTPASGFVNGILQFVCVIAVYITCTRAYSSTANIANQILGI